MFPDHLSRRGFFGAAGGLICATAGLARADQTFPPGEDLVIATVGHGMIGDAVSNGALLKAEQLSAAGGVLGHKIRLYKETVEFDPKQARSQANSAAARVLSERGIIAVIGHDSVGDALPAAISYLQGGIVFIAPTITSTGLTMHGLNNLFATLPDNAEISVQTARLGFDIGLRRAVILRDRGMDALEISLAYRDEAAVLGIVTVEERSFPTGTSPREFLAGLQGLRFDHLLIIGSSELQIALVKSASELGINVTCVLPTISNVDYMRGQIGHIAPRVLIPVLRDRSAPTPEQTVWERDYSARFGAPPIDAAIQGTDAVGLLAEGLNRVGSIDLAELKLVLHTELAYSGIGGRISFRQNGRIYTRLLGFASVRQNDVAYYMPGA
jgi:branched-chain amino acid transport system substrate-binding protein